MTILEEITARKRLDLQRQKELCPARSLYNKVEKMMDCTAAPKSLSAALLKSTTGIIAEFKRKSPSLGWIRPELQPSNVVPAYAQSGATALSILTDEPYFGGSPDFVADMRPLVQIPILRKEFIVDEYQIFETKALGADALLLIAACLKPEEFKSLARMARSLGLEVLLEVHEESEMDYLNDDVSVVGVNNRNLHLFKTDVQTSFRLSALLPPEFTKISESGLKDAAQLKLLRAAGYNGFLMGERFMTAPQPAQALRELIKQLEKQ